MVASERYTVLTGSSTYHTLSTVSFLTVLFNIFKGLTTNVSLIHQILFAPLLRLLFRFCITSYFNRLAPHSPNFENKYNFCILVYMEEWKDIKGYEGLYQVSNLGRVKSLCRNEEGHTKSYCRKEKILKPAKTHYLFVCLCKNGVKKNYRIHRLVAETFLPNPNGYKEVNHKTEDKTDNSVENLEWCDRVYNNNYGSRNERAGKKHQKKVCQYDASNGVLINTYNSCREAANAIGGHEANISACALGRKNSYYGFKWRYAS